MKKTILTLAALLFLSVTAAQVTAIQSANQSELKEFKEVYNNQTDQVPSFVGKIIGGERVNMKLEVNGSNETLGVAFKELKIENITKSGVDNPTMEVWTDQETVSSVIESESKYEAIRQELDEKDIEYGTTTVKAGVKVSIIETLNNLASMIGLNF